MDPIIGEFTITSGDDPASFKTTFPRSVKLDEGFEIALKSISHGPANNLVHFKIELCSVNTSKTLDLDQNRFYEAPSDILLEVHRVINAERRAARLARPPSKLASMLSPILYEKNNYLTLKLPEGYFIKINENMFLNRVFKYKLYEFATQSRKRKIGKATENNKLDKVLRTSLAVKNAVLSLEGDTKEMIKLLESLEDRVIAIDRKGAYLTNMYKKRYPEIKSVIENDESQKQFSEINKEIFDLYSKTAAGTADIALFKTKMSSIGDLLTSIESKYWTLEEEMKNKVNNEEEVIEQLHQKVDQGFNGMNIKVTAIAEYLTRNKEPDSEQLYAVDTNNRQITVSQNRILSVSEISTTMVPIIRTDLAFLYSSIIENSLIDARQSRLLTTIPITSKRGYNYFQFVNPIYKLISVRQFMEISFKILDKKGQPFQFNLYGDDANSGNPQYNTILNLHIRGKQL